MSDYEDKDRFICGTRRVIRREDGWYVVCATCGAGGSVTHNTAQVAQTACVRDSVRGCKACGAS